MRKFFHKLRGCAYSLMPPDLRESSGHDWICVECGRYAWGTGPTSMVYGPQATDEYGSQAVIDATSRYHVQLRSEAEVERRGKLSETEKVARRL